MLSYQTESTILVVIPWHMGRTVKRRVQDSGECPVLRCDRIPATCESLLKADICSTQTRKRKYLEKKKVNYFWWVFWTMKCF